MHLRAGVFPQLRNHFSGHAEVGETNTTNFVEPTDRPLNFILVAAVRQRHHDPAGVVAPCDIGDRIGPDLPAPSILSWFWEGSEEICYEGIRPELAGDTGSLVEMDESC